MEEFKNYSNSELMNMIDVLSQNHEKVKQELLILNEVLLKIQDDYVKINEELKSRT